MSQFSQQQQPTPGVNNYILSSQEFKTMSNNNIQHSLDLLTDDKDEQEHDIERKGNIKSSVDSLNQVSQSSDESTGSSSSMEVDGEETNHQYLDHRPHLAIIFPNFFRHQHGQQHEQQGIHENTNINSASSDISCSSDDSVIVLESRGVQTDLDFTEQHDLIHERQESEEDQEEDDNDEQFFDTGHEQHCFYKPFN